MGRPQKRQDYGSGVYRRSILLHAEGGRATGELEDDFHHFRAHIEHDGQCVTAVRGEALRVPWTTCPESARPLKQLEGLAVGCSLHAAATHAPPSAQCTHLFDAAWLAVAFAGLGRDGERRWDIAVPDRKSGRTTATLERDGELVLRWEVDRNDILDPPPFAGHRLVGGFGRWAQQTLDAELAEAALILQRGLFIAMGRRHDFDAMRSADEHVDTMGSACYTFGPDVVTRALRVHGSVRDYSARPQAVLAERPPVIDPDTPDAPDTPDER